MNPEAQQHLEIVRTQILAANRQGLLAQYLIGKHSVLFIQKCGLARRFAVHRLQGEKLDCDINLCIRTWAAIFLLHGDIEANPDSIGSLPPVGHFHKAWSQLVKRLKGERWVPKKGAAALYVQARDLPLAEVNEAVRKYFGYDETPLAESRSFEWLKKEMVRAALKANAKEMASLIVRMLANRRDALSVVEKVRMRLSRKRAA